jgi:NNP family nitrate/nitrite transporter-like MFS transporter
MFANLGLTSSYIVWLGVLVLGTMVIATGMGINNAAVFKKVPKEIPDAVSGASGWIGGLGAFGGFVMPPVFGSIASRMGDIGYARGFLVFVVLSVLGLLLIYALNRSDSPRDKPTSTPASS